MKTGIPKCAAAACILALVATKALAQAPQNTSTPWQPMREVVFGSVIFTSTGSSADRDLLQHMWAEDLAKPRPGAGGRKLPAFALLGEVPAAGQRPRLVFSMFAAADNERCTDAANGADASDIFNVCTMRVTAWPPTAGQAPVELPGYCMIFGNSDKQKNRIEYSVQQTAGLVVRFRTIQYGKVVEACSRTLKLG